MVSTSNTPTEEESARDIPGGRFGNIWAQPGFLIRRLHQIQAGLFAEECGKFDITPVQFGFLTVLYEEGELDQITISAAVGVDRTSGADVIKRLARRSLLTRMPSTEQQRLYALQMRAMRWWNRSSHAWCARKTAS